MNTKQLLSLRTNLQVLVIGFDLKSLSLDHKVFENCQGLRILQTVRYDMIKMAEGSLVLGSPLFFC